jgi:hypothetical protein
MELENIVANTVYLKAREGNVSTNRKKKKKKKPSFIDPLQRSNIYNQLRHVPKKNTFKYINIVLTILF